MSTCHHASRQTASVLASAPVHSPIRHPAYRLCACKPTRLPISQSDCYLFMQIRVSICQSTCRPTRPRAGHPDLYLSNLSSTSIHHHPASCPLAHLHRITDNRLSTNPYFREAICRPADRPSSENQFDDLLIYPPTDRSDTPPALRYTHYYADLPTYAPTDRAVMFCQ